MKWILSVLIILISFYCGFRIHNLEEAEKLEENTKAYAYAFSHYLDSKDASERIQEIYKRLKKVTLDSEGLADTIRVSKIKKGENAWVFITGQIFVTQELINNSSDDEIALILGHEIAHYQLRHTHPLLSESDREQKYQEYHSDLIGVYYAKRAGYDACASINVFKRRLKNEGVRFSNSHPSLLLRIYYLEC